MHESLSRRSLLWAAGTTVLLPAIVAEAKSDGTPDPPPTPSGPWPHFPHDDPNLIAEIVGKSHTDETRVRELVTTHPHLVNAWWDWGFGDWESPLGAASHTGGRAIAEFLIERGARIDIFAAAMLGYTDVVRAFVAAQPGLQRQLGPHGIPLLAHARAGGEKAKNTFEYLKSLGDAGNAPAAQTIAADEQEKFLGVYVTDNARFEIKRNNNRALVFAMEGEADRMIHWLGGSDFFPSGVPTTRLAFDPAANPVTVTITAGPLVRRAARA